MSRKAKHVLGSSGFVEDDDVIVDSKELAESEEEFKDLLKESFSEKSLAEERVVKGVVVGVDDECVLIDVGLKSEGRIPIKEFTFEGYTPDLSIGSIVDVHVERYEDKSGGILLSRERARQEATWCNLSDAFRDKKPVEGVITGRVKGGFTVDLAGAVAFLPGSQVDVRPVKDINALLDVKQPFIILKMESVRSNIVVSRRAVMEESRMEERKVLLSSLEQGKMLRGVVKNITDYGAFIDLGGIDGLLHVTDISWKRVKHPSDVLTIGQNVDVIVTRFNKETQRISLGMKQLEKDPWVGVEERYKIGQRVKGTVTNVTDCGAFVEVVEGIEGLVYVSEMAWTKKNIIPSQIVSEGQEVEVEILDVDPVKRRISLGLKQCTPNPLEEFAKEYPVGSEIDATIKDVTEFGLIVQLTNKIEGTVHKSDLSWSSSGDEALARYQVGDAVSLKVLSIDPRKEIIGLGAKQLSSDERGKKFMKLKKGDVVTCEVSKISDAGIEVKFAQGDFVGFIRRSDLSRDKGYQDSSRFAVGEKVDAMITDVQADNHKAYLSIKACEIDEEKKVMAEYGSSDSGARLGNILGAAMNKAEEGRIKKKKDDDDGEKL